MSSEYLNTSIAKLNTPMILSNFTLTFSLSLPLQFFVLRQSAIPSTIMSVAIEDGSSYTNILYVKMDGNGNSNKVKFEATTTIQSTDGLTINAWGTGTRIMLSLSITYDPFASNGGAHYSTVCYSETIDGSSSASFCGNVKINLLDPSSVGKKL
jgi:hypothetical protein